MITCSWHIDGSFPLAECFRSCSKNQETVRLHLPSIGVHPIKTRSHEPISRIRLLVPKIEHRRSDFKVPFLLAPFIFQEKACSIFICLFFKTMNPCGKVIFTVFTRFDFQNQQNSDRVNGPIKRRSVCLLVNT